jgi:hypothetical protein
VRLLAEAALQATGQAYAGFPKLITKLVGRGQSLLPALLAVTFEQINLIRHLLK